MPTLETLKARIAAQNHEAKVARSLAELAAKQGSYTAAAGLYEDAATEWLHCINDAYLVDLPCDAYRSYHQAARNKAAEMRSLEVDRAHDITTGDYA